MFCTLIMVVVTSVDFYFGPAHLVINLMLEILYKIQLSYSFIHSFIQNIGVPSICPLIKQDESSSCLQEFYI